MRRWVCLAAAAMVMVGMGGAAARAEGTLVSLGDSIARGYRLEDRKARYSAVAAEDMGLIEVNLGVNGQRADECLEWVREHEDEVRGARIVTLSMGANHALPLMLGGGDAEAEARAFGEQLKALMEKIASLAPEAGKAALTFYDPFETEESGEICDLINGVIWEWAGEYGFAVADAREAFRGRTGEYLMSGDIHPSETGHRELARIVEEALTGQ